MSEASRDNMRVREMDACCERGARTTEYPPHRTIQGASAHAGRLSERAMAVCSRLNTDNAVSSPRLPTVNAVRLVGRSPILTSARQPKMILFEGDPWIRNNLIEGDF